MSWGDVMSMYIISGRNDGLPCIPDVPDVTTLLLIEPVPEYVLRITAGANEGLPYTVLPFTTPAEPVKQRDYIVVHDMGTPQTGFGNHGLAILCPTTCRVTEVLNGEWSLYMEHPVDSVGKWQYLLEQNVIECHGQPFIIFKVEHRYSGNKGTVKVYADHAFYQMNGAFLYPGTIIPKSPNIKNVISRGFTKADMHIEAGQNIYLYTYDSDITMSSYGGEWDLTAGMSLTEFFMGTDGVIAYSGGELYRNKFYFSINMRMENARDNSFDIRLGRDLQGIRRTIDHSTICTYFRGYDNYGNWYAISYTPAALERRIPRHTVKAQLFHYDEPNFDQLVADSNTFFNENCKPRTTYVIDLVDVLNNPDFAEFSNKPRYKVGDTGKIYDERLGIDITLKITKTVVDAITGKTLQVTFGENRSFTRKASYSKSVVTPELVVVNEEIKRNKILALSNWGAVGNYTWGQLSEYSWNQVAGNTAWGNIDEEEEE